jgi:hypothetical protein
MARPDSGAGDGTMPQINALLGKQRKGFSVSVSDFQDIESKYKKSCYFR